MSIKCETCLESFKNVLEFSSSNFALSLRKSANSLMANVPPFMFWYKTLKPSFFSPCNLKKNKNALFRRSCFYK
jgi:hypothetical protein